MSSLPTALDAARSSRGYLFSVVALAVLLTALAAIQLIQDVRPAEAAAAQGPDGRRQESEAAEEKEQARPLANDGLVAAKAAVASAREHQNAALGELDRLNRTAQRLEQELRSQEAIVRQARRAASQSVPRDTARVAPPVETRDKHNRVTSLEQSLADLQDQRIQLLTRFTLQHPVVQDLDQKIAELDGLLQEARSERTIAPATPAEPSRRTDPIDGDEELRTAERRLQQLRDELEDLNASRDERTLRLAELQHEIAGHLEEIELAQAAVPLPEVGDPEVIEPGPRPANESHVGAFGLIFSLMMGCVVGSIAFVKAKPVNRLLSSRADVESILALPLIGLLPGTDNSPTPPPLPEPPVAPKLRAAAELTLGAFALATAAASVAVDGHLERLAAQPLSTVADGLRVMATQLFG